MEKVIQEIAKVINTQNKKIFIGISGHGASGKTTFANKLIEYLDESDVNYLNTDPYIIGSQIRKYTTIDYEYQNENHQFKMTACHPAAHQIDALERDINMMREGLDFYSIETSYVKSTLMSSQNKINIIEGMSVAFIDPNLIDLNIYLYTDGETELARRGIRDVSERGTDLQYLKQSHRQRRIQYEIFMHQYHQCFDVVIKNSNKGYHLEKNKL